MIYKLTILPYMEYAGFLVIACSVDDRRERCQNDALRMRTKQKISDHVRINDLHARCKIISLEQRRRNQLLLLMYKKSQDVNLHRVFPRNTRRSTQTLFRTANYEGALYKRSPYCVGAKLWDMLSILDIELPDIYLFKSRLKRLNNVYKDLLP